MAAAEGEGGAAQTPPPTPTTPVPPPPLPCAGCGKTIMDVCPEPTGEAIEYCESCLLRRTHVAPLPSESCREHALRCLQLRIPLVAVFGLPEGQSLPGECSLVEPPVSVAVVCGLTTRELKALCCDARAQGLAPQALRRLTIELRDGRGPQLAFVHANVFRQKRLAAPVALCDIREAARSFLLLRDIVLVIGGLESCGFEPDILDDVGEACRSAGVDPNAFKRGAEMESVAEHRSPLGRLTVVFDPTRAELCRTLRNCLGSCSSHEFIVLYFGGDGCAGGGLMLQDGECCGAALLRLFVESGLYRASRVVLAMSCGLALRASSALISALSGEAVGEAELLDTLMAQDPTDGVGTGARSPTPFEQRVEKLLAGELADGEASMRGVEEAFAARFARWNAMTAARQSATVLLDDTSVGDDGAMSTRRGKAEMDVAVQPLLSGEAGADSPAPDEFRSMRTASILQLALVAYFLVCGGPFGLELLVKAAGPGLALLSLVVVPLVWALPQAMMTAELSTMYPSSGGSIVWCAKAFGPAGAWMNGYNFLFDTLFDMSLYPMLAVSYLEGLFPVSEAGKWMLIMAMVFVVAAINVWGVEGVGNASIFFGLVMLAPFVIEFFMVAAEGRLRPDEWLRVKHERDIDWNVFLNLLLWSFSGWTSIGSLAGEVKDPTRNFPRAVLAGLVLSSLTYMLPIAVGVSLDTNFADWDEGHFQTIADRFHKWLGYWLVVGATISSLGTFNAQVASGSRVIWRLSKYGMLPKVFGFEWGPRRVPVVAIAVLCGAAVAMSSVSFDQLVEADNFVFSFVMLQAMAAFVYLKYKHPATVRPFEVPGGVYGSVLICLPPAALIVFVFSIAQWSTWVIAGATNLVCLIAYVLWQRRSINWLCSQQDATHKHDDDV